MTDDDTSIAMGAALDRIRELEDALIEACGDKWHTFSDGLCPDRVEGPWSRDPECPACQRLERLIGHRRPAS